MKLCRLACPRIQPKALRVLPKSGTRQALLRFLVELGFMDAKSKVDKSKGPLEENYKNIHQQMVNFDPQSDGGADVQADLETWGSRAPVAIATFYQNLGKKRRDNARKETATAAAAEAAAPAAAARIAADAARMANEPQGANE